MIISATNKLNRLAIPLALNLFLMFYLVVFHADSWWWLSPHDLVLTDIQVKIAQFIQFIAIANLLSQTIWYLRDKTEMISSLTVVPRLAIHITNFLIYFVFALAGLNYVFNQRLETFIAASGIFSIVVGFALRGLVSDFFCGIALAIDSNIRSGDWLLVTHKGREFKAKFIEFNWRLTCLVDGDGIGILIPNSEFSMVTVVNLTRPTTVAWYRVSLQLDTTVNEKQALTILQNAANKALNDGHVNSFPPPTARISAVSNGRITFTTSFTLPPERLSETAIHQILMNSLMFLKIADISVISLAHQTKIISQDHLASSKPVEQIELLARVRALSLLPFFFFIPPDDLMLLAQTTAVRKVSKNAEIFKKGDDAQSMFVVLEGSFQVILDDDGKQLTVANIWPGEYFGEMSLFTGAPRSATIVAQNDSTVIEIGKKTVEGLFNSHPSFANTIANIIEERMAINSKKITEENNAVQSTAKTSIGLLTSIKSFFNL